MAVDKQKYLLEMNNISKSFGLVKVLEDVNFNLCPGEVHILAGENGAGKSTLMKVLGGVYTDYAGQIKINGSEVKLKSVPDASSAGISIIHQELSVIGSLSIVENIFLGREKSKFSWLNKKQMYDYASELLDSLELKLNLTRSVDEFPIGIQQMVEIAKALAFNSNIIVMDEPTSALTEPEVEKLFEIIASLKKKGYGIIYISHKMEEIYKIADRITVLRDGEYIGTETSDKLPSQALVKWMVGRELAQQFPRHIPQLGKVSFEVKDLYVPGTASNPAPRVDKVSFSVKAGEILGIAGLQGSGNSELLNGIFGTYLNSATGDIKIGKQCCRPDSPSKMIKRGLALLTNDRKENGLVMGMNITLNATLASLSKFSPNGWLRQDEERLETYKTTTSLNLKAESLNQLVSSLSGGNQQKVVLAKWIQTSPKVLFLDEPTRGVDIGAKHEIYELMNQWTSQGIAIVLITSEMPELLAMSDRILVMHRGIVTAEFDRKAATQEKILNAALGERVA